MSLSVDRINQAKVVIRDTFQRKTDARKFFDRIRATYPIGEPVSDDSDEFLLHELALTHPRAPQKFAGQSVRGFEIGRNGKGKAGFLIDRADGSAIPFSYKKCLDQVYGLSRCKK